LRIGRAAAEAQQCGSGTAQSKQAFADNAVAALLFLLVLAPPSFAWLIRLRRAALMLERTGYRPQ
jgi:hypothetical protein